MFVFLDGSRPSLHSVVFMRDTYLQKRRGEAAAKQLLPPTNAGFLFIVLWVLMFSATNGLCMGEINHTTETAQNRNSFGIQRIESSTAPLAKRFQIVPVPTEEILVTARQVKFGTVGTTQTVRFLVRDENGEPLAGVRLTPVVVAEPEGIRQHMAIFPPSAITDRAGYVTFEICSGDQPGRYDILLFQHRESESSIVFTRLEFIAQDSNWATMLILSLLGGLAIFLYGLKIASDSLESMVSSRWKNNLATMTNTRWRAILIGFALTTLTQSSGATTALVMSFVRAGLLNFSNSVGIILGAAISGTITVQLISLNLFAYALPAIALGFGIYVGIKNKKAKTLGLAVMGFGFVFFGMKIMTDQMAPLKLFPFFTGAVKALADHPFWAVILSFLFTAAAQSSGATVGIVLSLTRQDLLTLEEAIPLFLGAAIGASVTGLTASIGSTVEAKRVALAHLIYKVFWTIVVLIFAIKPLAVLGIWVTRIISFHAEGAPAGDIMARAVANTYTLYMVITAALMIPLIPTLEKVCMRLVSGTAEPVRAKYLALSANDSPAVLLGTARREISRMGRFVEEMMSRVADSLFDKDPAWIPFIRERDTKVDILNVQLTAHLIDLTRRKLDEKELAEANALLFIISDIESIGDIIDKNLVPLAEKMIADPHKEFSPEGKEELKALHRAVSERLSQMIIALSTNERSLAEWVVKGFAAVQREGRLLHESHLRRLRKGVIESIETSSVHLDFINYLLRIDYLVFDICQQLLGRDIYAEAGTSQEDASSEKGLQSS
jgi:phosphate:Na+ symporter